MLIIQIEPNENGAHDNDCRNGDFTNIPAGFIAIPPQLEREAMSYLPYIDMDIVDGEVIAVHQGEIPTPEDPDIPEPTNPIYDELAAAYREGVNSI